MLPLRPLNEQVVVITGASSGIGREVARQFGAEGATTVLAARGRDALEDAATEVRDAGGTACSVPTDVSDWSEVERLAANAVERFGRIDTWVNVAGINVFGDFVDVPASEMRRVIEVDLLGQLHGTKAALPHMIGQGRGSIVNVGASASVRSVPLQAAFSAAMHGVRGFTDSLRVELASHHPEIALCIVMPASVNTPFYVHARSYLGGQPQPLPPIYHPGAVAEVVLAAATKHRRDAFVGFRGELLELVDAVDPSLLDWLAKRRGRTLRKQVSREQATATHNLERPMAAERYAAEGPWSDEAITSSFYSRQLQLQPNLERLVVTGALFGLVGGSHALAWWLGRRRRPTR